MPELSDRGEEYGRLVQYLAVDGDYPEEMFSVYENAVCENDYSKDLGKHLNLLLERSMEKDVKLYLIEHGFLSVAKSVTKYCSNEPELIGLILGIIVNICCTAEEINFISNDKDLVVKILSCLRYNDTNILIQVFIFLQSVVKRIKEDSLSIWIISMKKCEFFGKSIISILNNSFKDELLMEAIALLQSICLSQSTIPSKKNFLEELFEINNLIPVLLKSFMRVIRVKKRCHSLRELDFIKNWLEIFITLVNSNSFSFNKYRNDENLLKLIVIICRIIIPYKHTTNLFPIKQPNFEIIHKSMFILYCFHYFYLNVPPRVDYTLMNMIFSLKKDTNPGNEDLDLENTILFKCLHDYWLFIVKICSKEYLTELFALCKSDISNYLIKLAMSNLDERFEVLDKIIDVINILES